MRPMLAKSPYEQQGKMPLTYLRKHLIMYRSKSSNSLKTGVKPGFEILQTLLTGFDEHPRLDSLVTLISIRFIFSVLKLTEIWLKS